MSLKPGTTLGRYQILAPLGHGGMASVYGAYQPALDRVVALMVHGTSGTLRVVSLRFYELAK